MAHQFCNDGHEFDGYSTALLNFRTRINCIRNADTPPVQFTCRAIQQRIFANYGRHDMNFCESLTCDTLVKPYFDYDLYTDEAPCEQLKESTLANCLDLLKEVFCLSSSDSIAIAQRHGTVDRNGRTVHKVSYRFFVQGFSVKVKHLAALLDDDETLPEFDKSIYPDNPRSGERLISMVGCCKGKYKPNQPLDARVLQPYDASRPYHHYVIQSLTGTETLLDLPDRPRPPTRRRMPTDQGKPAWLTLTEVEAQGLAVEAMVAAGMRTGFTVGRLHNNVVILETVGARQCMHDRVHESNNCSVSFRRDGVLLYHCNSAHCANLDPPQIGFWRKCLEERLTLDALLPEQRREFDVALLTDLENAVHADDPGVKKLTKCQGYPLFRRFCVAYCNLFFAHVFLAKPEVVEFFFDEEFRPEKYERRTLGATKEVTEHAGAAFSIWMKHPEKLTYDGYFFDPDLTAVQPRKINLCTGSFPMQHVSKDPLDDREMAIIEPLLKLLREDLCAGIDEHYEYVLDWNALPLQKLGAKTGTAILVFGSQGTGKTLFFGDLFRQIYGESFYYIANSKDEILGKFNRALGGRLYLHADEAGFFSGYRDESAKLKTLITGTTITIEGKNENSVQLPNFANLVVTTNESHAVRLDMDDRRWIVLHPLDTHRNDQEYFAPLAELVNHPATPVLFYRYLVNRDISNFNPRLIPACDVKHSMQLKTRSVYAAFLQDVCCRPFHYGAGSAPFNIDKRDFYDHFVRYCETLPSHMKHDTLSEFVKGLRVYGVEPTTVWNPNLRKAVSGYRQVSVESMKAALEAKGVWDVDAEV